MNLEEDILIQRYLRKELSETELELFHAKLASDTAFSERVALERALSESLNDEDWHFVKDYDTLELEAYQAILKSDSINHLKSQIQKSQTRFKDTPVKTLRSPWRLYVGAAAAVLLVMVSLYSLFFTGDTTEMLYNNYLRDSNIPSVVSRDTQQGTLGTIEAQFSNEDYAAVLNTLATLEPSETSNHKSTLLLYKGISEMELEQFEAADKSFETLINSDFLIAERGYWFKALLLLKQENIEASKRVLNTIISKNYSDTDAAKKLLKALE